MPDDWPLTTGFETSADAGGVASANLVAAPAGAAATAVGGGGVGGTGAAGTGVADGTGVGGTGVAEGIAVKVGCGTWVDVDVEGGMVGVDVGGTWVGATVTVGGTDVDVATTVMVGTADGPAADWYPPTVATAGVSVIPKDASEAAGVGVLLQATPNTSNSREIGSSQGAFDIILVSLGQKRITVHV